MSQHSSLRIGRRSKQHRSVLKRYERLQTLQGKEEWKEGDSVLGLPKVKTLRIRIKKEKAAETAAVPGTEAPAATAGAAAQPQAPAKGAVKEAAKAAPKEAASPKKEVKKEKGKA